jgi:hypothetical protein
MRRSWTVLIIEHQPKNNQERKKREMNCIAFSPTPSISCKGTAKESASRYAHPFGANLALTAGRGLREVLYRWRRNEQGRLAITSGPSSRSRGLVQHSAPDRTVVAESRFSFWWDGDLDNFPFRH